MQLKCIITHTYKCYEQSELLDILYNIAITSNFTNIYFKK